MSNQPPINKKRSGKVVACEWQGEKFNSFTFEYNWKDKEGNWKNSKSIPVFALQDLVGASQAMLVKSVLTPEVPKPAPTYQSEPTIPQAGPQGNQTVSDDTQTVRDDTESLPF